MKWRALIPPHFAEMQQTSDINSNCRANDLLSMTVRILFSRSCDSQVVPFRNVVRSFSFCSCFSNYQWQLMLMMPVGCLLLLFSTIVDLWAISINNSSKTIVWVTQHFILKYFWIELLNSDIFQSSIFPTISGKVRKITTSYNSQTFITYFNICSLGSYYIDINIVWPRLMDRAQWLCHTVSAHSLWKENVIIQHHFQAAF